MRPNEQDESLPAGCEARCRGCRYRQLSRGEGHARKMAWLQRILQPWAAQLQPIKDDQSRPWHYRRKVQLAAHFEGTWQLGLRWRDEVIAIPNCPIHTPRINDAARIIVRYLPDFEAFPLFAYAQTDRQVVLVVKSKTAALNWVNDEVRDALARIGIEGLWVHYYPAAGIRLFAKSGWQLLWGQPTSQSKEGLIYGPTTFLQQQGELHEQAIELAKDFLAPKAGDAVLDLYCGLGASLRHWLMRTPKVLGVEWGAEAVELAKLNAPGAEILRGLVTERLPQIRQWWKAQAASEGFIYLNPPRTGGDLSVLQWISQESRPRRIAYLACAARSLGRDLQRLDSAGYRVDALYPFDFFPQTDHVETLALLSRGS